MSGADVTATSAASTDVTASTDAAFASVDAASADAAVATPDAAAAGDAVGGDTAAGAPAHSFACLRRQCLEARATAQLEARACKAPPSQFFHLDAAGKVCFSAGTLGSALGLALCLPPLAVAELPTPPHPNGAQTRRRWRASTSRQSSWTRRSRPACSASASCCPSSSVTSRWGDKRCTTRATKRELQRTGIWRLAPSSRRPSSHHTWNSVPNELQSRLRQCSRAMLLRRPLPCSCSEPFPRRWRRASATRRCTVR